MSTLIEQAQKAVNLTAEETVGMVIPGVICLALAAPLVPLEVRELWIRLGIAPWLEILIAIAFILLLGTLSVFVGGRIALGVGSLVAMTRRFPGVNKFLVSLNIMANPDGPPVRPDGVSDELWQDQLAIFHQSVPPHLKNMYEAMFMYAMVMFNPSSPIRAGGNMQLTLLLLEKCLPAQDRRLNTRTVFADAVSAALLCFAVVYLLIPSPYDIVNEYRSIVVSTMFVAGLLLIWLGLLHLRNRTDRVIVKSYMYLCRRDKAFLSFVQGLNEHRWKPSSPESSTSETESECKEEGRPS